jgi:hypothetical protein
MTIPTSSQCRLSYCHVPDTPCDRGEYNYRKDCPHFVRSDSPEAVPEMAEQITEFPWTGNTLGLDELGWLAACGRPRIFAPVGAHNAGKTTFLIALYLGLSRGVRLTEQQFTGSYTFGGWENLAHYLRYPPQGIGPGFPPHTPVASKTAPGLLHFALRRNGRLLDILLSDAPGEWFTNWSVNVAHPEAAGARWIARHADGFLLFVDCDVLAGSDRGVARDGLFRLAQRLAACTQKCPVAVVWAKSDIQLSPTMREQVEMRLKQLFPTAQHFATSVKQSSRDIDTAEPFFDVLEWLLSQRDPTHDVPELSVKRSEDPFLAFRGRGV